MEAFKIILSPKAQKDLDSLSDNTCVKISKEISVLKDNPFPKGKLIKKLKGKRYDYYRLRTDKYRVFYLIDKRYVVILRILSKKDTEKFIKSLN